MDREFICLCICCVCIADFCGFSPTKKVASASKVRFGTAKPIVPLKSLVKPEVVVPVARGSPVKQVYVL